MIEEWHSYSLFQITALEVSVDAGIVVSASEGGTVLIHGLHDSAFVCQVHLPRPWLEQRPRIESLNKNYPRVMQIRYLGFQGIVALGARLGPNASGVALYTTTGRLLAHRCFDRDLVDLQPMGYGDEHVVLALDTRTGGRKSGTGSGNGNTAKSTTTSKTANADNAANAAKKATKQTRKGQSQTALVVLDTAQLRLCGFLALGEAVQNLSATRSEMVLFAGTADGSVLALFAT